MGEEKKKWNVTYTKHVKQKRKIYEDGFLQLDSSTHKAKLYDDCEKLLGCKIVKNDDDVKTGETLAFDSYLVDIGDPHGDYKPILELNTQLMNKKVKVEPGLLHSGKSSAAAADNRKSNLGKKKAPPTNLSPSQKIIREFKKSEVCKYGSSPSSLDITKSSTKEWQVLYTTQMTQKAKKFHDGFLQLVMSGSHGKQIMLYDATRRLLDSRFLRKTESIMSGVSVSFDGHLVDIGECVEDQKLPKDIGHIKEPGERGPVHREVAIPIKLPAEWDAMYTTQITQKAKKFNNGILRLSSSGSYQSQVTLLIEDGSILGRKFLKLSEQVTTGATLNLPGYLVEVGDMRTGSEGKPQDGASSIDHAQSDIKIPRADNIKLSRRIPFNRPIPNRKPQNGAFSLDHVESKTGSCTVDNSTNCRISGTNSVRAGNPQNGAVSLDHVESKTTSCTVDNTTSCRISGTNSVRAAHEILSILKKPITSKGAGTARDITHADDYQLSQSSTLACINIKSQTEHLMQDFNDRGTSLLHREEETIMMHSNGRSIPELKVSEAFHLDGISQPDDCADRRVSHNQSLSLSTELGATEIPSCDVEYTVTKRSPTAKLKHLAIPESDSKVQAVEQNKFNKILEFENALESVSHLDTPSRSVHALPDACTLTHAPSKPSVDDKQLDTSNVIADASNDSAPQFPFHLKKMNSQHDTSTCNMDEFPSFDLGF